MLSSLVRTVLRLSAQCIWFSSSFPRVVYDFEMVICHSRCPPDLPLIPNFCFEEILENLVVGVYRHGFFCSYQVVVSFLKSFQHCK